MGYGKAECDLADDGKPPPRAGNWFVSVHGGRAQPGPANARNLDEVYSFSVTLTGRVTIPLDQIGTNLIARNVPLVDASGVPLAQRQGFNAKVEQLRAYLHMNWTITVLQGQTPNSANDNLVAWASGSNVYGFALPAAFRGAEVPTLVGGDWLGAEPDAQDFALKSELSFGGARRFQMQTAAVGAFV